MAATIWYHRSLSEGQERGVVEQKQCERGLVFGGGEDEEGT